MQGREVTEDPVVPLRRHAQIRQSYAALARASSIFLRKMVIDDRDNRKTRLLDDEVRNTVYTHYSHRICIISLQ